MIPCNRPDRDDQTIRNTYAGLGKYIAWFKRMSTNAYIRGVKQSLFPHFEKRFWQRGFYDRIIRDEKELNRTREYIINNPLEIAPCDPSHRDISPSMDVMGKR